jgi:ABC-type transport system involved in multi-copper enzyme maturation permease subunit
MIAIAGLTIREAVRRKVLWVLVGLAALAVGVTGWGVSGLVDMAREAGAGDFEIVVGISQVEIFIAFMFGFVLVMTAAFLAAPAIASDLESGVALALLARPLRRSSYLVGRWLGLAVVIVGYAAGSGFAAIGVVGLITGYWPPSVVLPLAFLAAESIVLLTLSIALSTRLPPIAGGAVAVVAFGLAWFGGVLGGVGRALGADALSNAGRIVSIILPTDGLWRGVVYGLEPPVLIATVGGQGVAEGNPFFAATPPPPAFLAWVVAWLLLVLGLAIASLRRREL